MFQEDSGSHDPKNIGKGRKPVLPPPGQKWTPAEARLEHHVTPGGCGTCLRFNAQRGSCELVAGFIQADGCCDYYLGAGMKEAYPPPPPPVSKFDSGYIRVKGAQYLCADCTFFQKDGPGTCQIVAGPIKPDDVCVEWAGGPSTAAGGQPTAEAATEQATADALGASPLRPDHGGDNS